MTTWKPVTGVYGTTTHWQAKVPTGQLIVAPALMGGYRWQARDDAGGVQDEGAATTLPAAKAAAETAASLRT